MNFQLAFLGFSWIFSMDFQIRSRWSNASAKIFSLFSSPFQAQDMGATLCTKGGSDTPNLLYASGKIRKLHQQQVLPCKMNSSSGGRLYKSVRCFAIIRNHTEALETESMTGKTEILQCCEEHEMRNPWHPLLLLQAA